MSLSPVPRHRSACSQPSALPAHHTRILEITGLLSTYGILTTAEFPIAYQVFLPGVGATWKARVKPGTSPQPALQTDLREWEASIKRLRNHPSILCWVRGNELYNEPTLRDEFSHIAQNLDPGRWYVDTDGLYLADPKKDRKTTPLYLTQFAEWDNPIGNADKFKTPKLDRPVLSHETANYITFSRPDLVDQFQHNIKPFWLMVGKARLKTLGLSEEADAWAEKSERLYALLHKNNLEWLRKNPCISGYHWWLFQDYWTSSNGLVDHYFRPKSITPQEVLKINNDVVLLQDGLERTYRGRSPLKLKLLVSNFSTGTAQRQLDVGADACRSVACLQGDVAAARGAGRSGRDR